MTNDLKLLSPTVGAPVTTNPATGKPPRWKMALDVERCIGCHACSVACKVEHGVPLGRYRTKVYYWEHGKFPNVKRNFLPTLCMQCEDAPCLKACPTKAIDRQTDGIVRIDPDVCDHDGACEKACPYAAIGCDDNDVADKCDFCSNRLSVGMEPACVETCPAEVFYFGDANDAQSFTRAYWQCRTRQATPGMAAPPTHATAKSRCSMRGMIQPMPKINI